jgi:surface protein
MASMFASSGGGQFNADISDWNVSRVTDMSYMFKGTSVFDQDLGSWDVSWVTRMTGMFEDSDAAVNPNNEQANWNIHRWNVRRVRNMDNMFNRTFFNVDISGWCVAGLPTEPINFAGSALEKGSPGSVVAKTNLFPAGQGASPDWNLKENGTDLTGAFTFAVSGTGISLAANLGTFQAVLDSMASQLPSTIEVFDYGASLGLANMYLLGFRTKAVGSDALLVLSGGQTELSYLGMEAGTYTGVDSHYPQWGTCP